MRSLFSSLACGLVCGLLTGAASPLLAQDHRQEIDVHAEDEDLRSVIDRIARQTGRNILVHPDVNEKVTIHLYRVSWRTAVDLIARMTDCQIEEYRGGHLGLKRPRRVSIQFNDANLRTVLMLLAEQAQVNIILGPDVTGSVTCDLKDVEYLAAMKAIVDTAGGGRYALVGSARASERSLKIGDTASKAPAPPTPPAETVQGRLIDLSATELVLKQGKVALTLHLPADKALRQRIRRALQRVGDDAEVVLTYRDVDGRKVVADVIARSR